MGIAKLSPELTLPKVVTVKPMSLPLESTSAPPAAVSGTWASVWMQFRIVEPFLFGMERLRPLTTPALSVVCCRNEDTPLTPSAPLVSPAPTA